MVFNYNSKKFNVLFGSPAPIPIKGFPNGSFFSVNYNVDTYESELGCEAEVAISKTSDLRATVTLKLQQSSPSNVYLSICHLMNQTNFRFRTFTVADLNGTSFVYSNKVYIKQVANIEMGSEVTEREWKFELLDAMIIPGGGIPVYATDRTGAIPISLGGLKLPF